MEQDIARYRSGQRESSWFRYNGKRLLWAVVVGSLFHATACIVARPFEFGNGDRIHTFLKALFSGLISFPIVFAALLWPLQALMQWRLPRASRWVQGIVAVVALLALVAVWILVRFYSGVTLPAYCHGYFWHSLFWCSFVVVVVAAYFWPADS